MHQNTEKNHDDDDEVLRQKKVKQWHTYDEHLQQKSDTKIAFLIKSVDWSDQLMSQPTSQPVSQIAAIQPSRFD